MNEGSTLFVSCEIHRCHAGVDETIQKYQCRVSLHFKILSGIRQMPFEQAAMECCLKHVCKDLLESARNVEPRLRTVGCVCV